MIIIKNAVEKATPLFCPICEFIMTVADIRAYSEYECCATCSQLWAEWRPDEWRQGVRPSLEAVEAEKHRRRTSRMPQRYD